MNVQGQALVETLVAVLLLVPLFLFVTWVSRWQLLQERAQVASRHAAFEMFHGGVRADSISIAERARIAVNDVMTEDVLDFEVRIVATDEPQVLATIGDTAFALLQPARWLGSGEFDVAAHSAFVVTSTALANRPEFLAFIDAPLRFQSRTAMLGAHFDAGDDATVLRRAGGLSVAGRIADVSSVIGGVRAVLRFVEPALTYFCPGRIATDIVPADRLRGTTLPPSMRWQSC